MSAPPAIQDLAVYMRLFPHIVTRVEWVAGACRDIVIQLLQGVIFPLLIIYIAWWGWGMIRGMIKEPVVDGFMRIVKMAVVFGVALNMANNQTRLIDFFWDAPDALSDKIARAYDSRNFLGSTEYGKDAINISSLPSGSFSASGTYLINDLNHATIFSYLDRVLSIYYAYGKVYNDKAVEDPDHPIMPMQMYAVTIWGIGGSMTAVAFFSLMFAKLAIAVLVAALPVVIVLLLFEPTKRLFGGWFRNACHYMLVTVLTTVVVHLFIRLANSYTHNAYKTIMDILASSDATVIYHHGLQSLIYGALAMFALSQVTTLATAIVGGGAALNMSGASGFAMQGAALARMGVIGRRMSKSLPQSAGTGTTTITTIGNIRNIG